MTGEILQLEKISEMARKLEELQHALACEGVTCEIVIALPEALRNPPHPNRAYLESLTTLILEYLPMFGRL